jgi:hypothetical protein
LSVEFQLEEPALIEKAKDIFNQGISYTTGKEFLKIVPEFADVILVISDSNFPYMSEPVNNHHEVLSCQCGVLGRHIIFFCGIIEDSDNRTKQTKKFNLVICPTMQMNFIKSLQDIAREGRPLQLVLMGKHAYNFHLRNIQQSSSIWKAGHNIKSQIKAHPQLMGHFVRCDDIDISAVACDYYQNSLYQEVFFDTFEVVKNYCPICTIKK